MPLIDPVRLLRCLSPLLNEGTGAIKSEREVDKLYGLMSKYSRKLVSKCIYINILKVTPPPLLDLFMTRGGWEMLNGWLTDAINNRNCALLVELLNLLDLVPASVERLKQFEVGRMVKALSKDGSLPPLLQENSKQLVGKWMAIVNPPQQPPEQAMDALQPQTTEIDDLTGLLDLKDLNSLQFNPDTFNMALDSLGSAPMGVGVGDGEVSDIIPVDGDPTKFDDSSTLAVIDPETLNVNDQQYELNNRDGKMYIKVRANEGEGPVTVAGADAAKENDAPMFAANDTTTEESTTTDTSSTATGERKRSRKDPTIKKAPGGKPPMRTYEHLYEDSAPKKSSSASVKEKEGDKSSPPKPATATKAKGGKPPMGPIRPEKEKEKEKDKEKDKDKDKSAVKKKSTSKSGDAAASNSKSSTATATSGLTKSQRELEEQRQLRIKVKEQKRIAEERRKKADQEAQLKAQKQRDEETLKSLNLVALGTKTQPMAKIPKRPAAPISFADAIGTPGAGSEKTSASKSSSVKRQNSQEEKEKEKDKQKSAAGALGAAIGGDRQRVISHPKVKVTTKTRGLGLIEDMTKGGPAAAGIAEGPKTRSSDSKEKEKDKEKEKEKSKDKDKESSADPSKSKSSAKSSSGGESPSTATSASKIKKKRTSSESSAGATPDINEPSKKPKLNLNDDSTVIMETDEDEPKTPVSTPDTPVTPPVRKVVGLQESSLFMDALTATTQSISSRDRERRLKRRSSSTASETPAAAAGKPSANNNKSEPATPPPPAASKPVFNFYRETLTEGDGDEDGKPDEEEKAGTRAGPPSPGTPEAEPEPEDMETTPPPTAKPAMQIKPRSKSASSTSPLKSILHMHRPGAGVSKPPKKTVQWVEDEKLSSYFYFEMDETERVNVTRGSTAMGVLGGFGFGFAEAEADAAENESSELTHALAKPKNFAEMKQMEKAQEKKLVKRRGLFGAMDIMEEKIEWAKPWKIDLEGLAPECVVDSQQVAVQEEREKGTLQVFYFTKHDIPDCPDESMAVVEHFDPNRTTEAMTVIPFEDVPGVTKVTRVETPEDQQQLLLQQQQEAAAAALQQQFGGAAGIGAFSLQQQQALGSLWGAGAAAAAAAAAGAAPVAPNPFALAMAFAATASATQAANGGLDPAAWAAATQQPFQQPPSLLGSNFANPYQGQEQNQGYDDYGGGGGDQATSFRNHGQGQGGRGGRGGGRRQFSRFDNSGGGRNQQGQGRGGGRGDWDRDRDDRQGGDRRNNRMGNHNFREGGGGRGGRDFRGGRGGHDDGGGPPKRERGRVGRTVLCKFFAQGTCKAGPGCDFLHPGINGPNRGGRFNNSGGGGVKDWQQSRGPRRRDGGGGSDEGYSNESSRDQQDTSPASPEPDFGTSTEHRPIEFGEEES